MQCKYLIIFSLKVIELENSIQKWSIVEGNNILFVLLILCDGNENKMLIFAKRYLIELSNKSHLFSVDLIKYVYRKPMKQLKLDTNTIWLSYYFVFSFRNSILFEVIVTLIIFCWIFPTSFSYLFFIYEN